MAKRALCVGINEFANLPMASWLNGCVNDATDMAAMLRRRGFTGRATTVLADSAATKSAVLGALTKLVGTAKAGDHIVFSFSSHGTQVPDRDGDEPDRADECFACYDLAQQGNQWDRSTVIVDDELRALFAGLAKGVLVEVFLDTCHSGTGLKPLDLLSGRRPKFLPPPTAIGYRQLGRADRGGGVSGAMKGVPAALRPVLYAGCRDDQTSADATFDGRPNGAFTYYLLAALAAAPQATRAELHKTMTASLRAGDFDQRPTLEGPAKAKKTPLGDAW